MAARRRVVVAAGGTGGHFYPGLVLAQTLAGRGWEPLMLVRTGDPALSVLEREGLASCELPLRGLPRALGRPALTFAFDLARSLSLASRIVRDFKPDIVVGMGGYLTFPAIAAAARRGVPRAIHESNAVLGLANRAAAALGARLIWGLPPASGGEVAGTPIRPSLWKRTDAEDARRELGLSPRTPTVLVFGGSQGARGLNRAAPGSLAAIKGAPGSLQVLHLSGAKEAPEVAAAYAASGLKAVVLPYLDRMELAYACADLVICRSGASTLAELSAQRAPALLVPFPSAVANHQEVNARILERAGACRVVLERELGDRLAAQIGDLLISSGAPERRQAMQRAYETLGLPDAQSCPGRLADVIETLSEKT